MSICAYTHLEAGRKDLVPTNQTSITKADSSSKSLAVRDRSAEKLRALDKKALRLGELVDDRNTGKLGEEVIKLA